jgi:hypothetical protein
MTAATMFHKEYNFTLPESRITLRVQDLLECQNKTAIFLGGVIELSRKSIP